MDFENKIKGWFYPLIISYWFMNYVLYKAANTHLRNSSPAVDSPELNVNLCENSLECLSWITESPAT